MACSVEALSSNTGILISEACNQAPHVKDILTACYGEGGAQIAME